MVSQNHFEKNKGNFSFGKYYVVGMDQYWVYNIFRINTKNKFSNLKTNVLTIDLSSTESNKHKVWYPTIALYVGEKVSHPYGSY